MPACLDDYIDTDNPVRVIDLFVDELDLIELGFDGTLAAATGRPGYHPALLLKIYIYGYLNRIQSNRRLERETQRNIELMWLTGQLSPDVKTIADRGYYKGPEILKCVEAGITPSVPKTMTSENKARGLYGKRDFVYIEADNAYRCPAGERLIYRHSSLKDGMRIDDYYASYLLSRLQ